MQFRLVLNPLTGCVVPVPASGVALYHETDENGDSQPIDIMFIPPVTISAFPTAPYPSQVDSNGDLELAASIVYPTVDDPYYELDVNGDIQHKAGV